MTNRIKSIAAAVLVAVMLLTLVGCYGDTNEWAVRIGDTEISTGVYLGIMVTNYFTAQSEATGSGNLMDKKIGDKTVAQWILDETMDACYSYAYVEKLFDELGLEFTKDEKTELNKEIDEYWEQMAYALEKNGCNKSSLGKILINGMKAQKIFEHYYHKGGDREIAEADRKAYFLENYAKCYNLYEYLYNTSTYSKLTDAEINELKKDFRAIIAAVTEGGEFNDAADAYMKEVAEEAAKEQASNSSSKPTSSSSTTSETSSKETSSETSSKETSSEETSGSDKKEETKLDPDRYVVILPKEGSGYPEDFTKKLFEMKNMEIAMTETSTYLFVAQRLPLADDTEAFEKYNDLIIKNMKVDEFEAELIAEGKKLEIVKNDAAIARFRPHNIEGRIED